MKKLTRLVAVSAAFALVLAACGTDEEGGATTTAGVEETTTTAGGTTTTAGMEETTTTAGAAELTLVAPGTLTVCTDAPYPPMEFEDPEAEGGFTGFDIELMRAIADDLGLELAVVNSGFDPITSGAAMEAGQCDIAAASITILEEREQNVDFTDPYFAADQSLLVKKDSGFAALADLAGERIGVQSGTTGEAYANENAPEGAEIVAFDNPGDLFVALEAGDIQGILQDIVVNQGRTLEDDTVTVAETFPTDEQYGFAVKEEGSEDLLQTVNDALATMQEDGTYDQLFEEWFGS